MQTTDNPLFLTAAPADRQIYRSMIMDTVDAILASIHDTKAYVGLTPGDLKSIIGSVQLLPEKGVGTEKVLEEVSEMVMPNCLQTASTDYMAHLHSPALLESITAELIISTFNQSMDSWDQSPVATEIEIAVINQLCKMYNLGGKADGVFTSGGSQSNLYGLTLARDYYCNTVLRHDVKKLGLPGVYDKMRVYASEVSHFSMEKSAHLLGLGYNAVVKVPVDEYCRMDVSKLRELLKSDIEAGLLPFCVVSTAGTTDYGSIDPVEALSAVCNEYGIWLHCDAAYGSGVIMSDRYSHRLGTLGIYDSITVDFHKMFLLPISCSAFLVRDKATFDSFMLRADYLNREEDEWEGYTNLVGKSMQTTRRFDALKVWMAFRTRGKSGYGEIIDTCIENAEYLFDRLCSDPVFEVAIKPEISSVVFRLNSSCEVNKKVRRKLIHEHGVVIGQTVYAGKVFLKFTLLNPLLTREKLDSLVDLIKSIGSGL